VKADQDIEIESQKAQIQLRDSVVTMAIGAAEKVIGERLDDDVHRRLITEYIDTLEKGGSPEVGDNA
jgi:F0F1-type ATP synthase membrane subunit b/b'